MIWSTLCAASHRTSQSVSSTCTDFRTSGGTRIYTTPTEDHGKPKPEVGTENERKCRISCQCAILENIPRHRLSSNWIRRHEASQPLQISEVRISYYWTFSTFVWYLGVRDSTLTKVGLFPVSVTDYQVNHPTWSPVLVLLIQLKVRVVTSALFPLKMMRGAYYI